MGLKLVAFESNVSGRSLDLWRLVGQIGESVRLTDATFVLDTPLSTAEVLKKLMKAVDLDDDVYVLELSSFWSGYGTPDVNQFLQNRLKEDSSAVLTL